MEAPRREPEERPEQRAEIRRTEEGVVHGRPAPRVVGRTEFAPFEAVGEDIISWGAIWAGLVGALAVLVLLSLIGVGIGLTTMAPGGPAGAPPGAVVWGIIVTAAAFFFGGWLAGRTSTDTSTMTGLLNGGLVWGLSLLLSFAFAIVGLGSLLGLPIANVLGVIGPPGAAPAPPSPAASATAIWMTVLVLVIGLAAALLGGVVGARSHPSYYERP